jgi:hypothetical protein
LTDRLDRFIAYFNKNFAKPMNWTYTGRRSDTKVDTAPLTWREKRAPKSWKDDWEKKQELLAA